jgi:amidase
MLAGREPTIEDLEPLTWEFYRQGMATTGTEYLQAVAVMQLKARSLISFFSEYDVLLTPALAQPPLRIGELDTCSADPMVDWGKAAQFTPFTAAWNVTGQPAISLPVAQGDDGLPRAVQLVGPPVGEGLLLSLAAQMETARPWANRLPPGV